MLPFTPDRPLVFLHNPKAGGTAVASALKTMFAPGDVAPVFDNSPDERDPSLWPRMRKYSYLGGHFGAEVVPQPAAEATFVTNFRNPVTRTASLYSYWRGIDPLLLPERLRDRSGPAFANALTFSDFIRSDDPYLSLYLENFHTRQLLGSGWLSRRITVVDVLRARRRIRRMPWFYVCEQPKASAAWLRRVFGVPGVEVENRSGTAIVASREDARLITRRNWADAHLHRYAIRLLSRR